MPNQQSWHVAGFRTPLWIETGRLEHIVAGRSWPELEIRRMYGDVHDEAKTRSAKSESDVSKVWSQSIHTIIPLVECFKVLNELEPRPCSSRLQLRTRTEVRMVILATGKALSVDKPTIPAGRPGPVMSTVPRRAAVTATDSRRGELAPDIAQARARDPRTMSTHNTLADIDHSEAAAVSREEFCIAGLLTTVYGLEQLHTDASQVGCLWLLHPRLQTQGCVEPLARSMIGDWNSRRTEHGMAGQDASSLGLVAVSFDQRNHGSRRVLPLANEAWRSGNKRHAQDMFSIYHGTAMDTSLLLDHLESYIFPSASRRIATNIVVGVSLGGHAAWQCIVHEPRIKAAVVGIGCPDYIRLMSHRAAKSKLGSWTTTTTTTPEPGAFFIGSPDFPPSLVEAVQKWDPTGLLMNEQYDPTDDPFQSKLSRETVERHLGGKSIFSQSGGADKLVPYSCSRPFLTFLESIAASSSSNSIRLKDVVYPDVAHEMTTEMLNDATAFVMQLLHETWASLAE